MNDTPSEIVFWVRWLKSVIIPCLFIVIAGIVYINSLSNSFQYDDRFFITENYNIRLIKNIPHFFIEPKTLFSDSRLSGHYRPVVVTSYAINYALGGLNPAGYRLVNLGFHLGSAFLVFLILAVMLGGKERVSFSALAGGLIFLVHPFNS